MGLMMSDEVVETLDYALHRKRLTAFGFKFKEIHKKLNLDDTEDGDLTNTDNEDLREDLTNIILRYQWNIGVKN
ncbi:MAG: protein rep, partial [Erysipelothrix sp.]|nr:protein rep [Erysipelothrix sp.]